MRKNVLDTHYQLYGEAATKMLAGHSQRSHTLKTNYIRVDNRIGLTAGATDEEAPVVPQTAAANQ